MERDEKVFKRLNDAVIEAKRFINKAEIAKDFICKNSFYSSKEIAAAKRASMDLTRTLVEIRKPY